MSTGNSLDDVEQRLRLLPMDEQLLLVERLLHHLRVQRVTGRSGEISDLASMAADPEIQHELREIQAEFASADLDGLETS
jgi:hypothetical protein